MKAKPPKEIQKRREEKPYKEQKPPIAQTSKWKKFEWTIGVAGIVLAVAGLLLTALQYQARPTVSLGTALDQKDVLTTPITISNDGLTDLKDIRIESFFNDLEYGNIFHAQEAFGARMLDKIDTLLTGEKEDVLPAQMIMFGPGMKNPPITKLDFALIISFRPAYWPFTKRRFFRFRFSGSKDGTLRLRPVAAEDIEKISDEVRRKNPPPPGFPFGK